MNYILVGKQSALLNAIKEKAIRNVTVYNSAVEFNENYTDSENTKVIYIHTPIRYNWEWWMETDIFNKYNRDKFVDETIDFRNLNTDDCDKVFNFDGTNITGIIEEINKFITEVENGSN